MNKLILRGLSGLVYIALIIGALLGGSVYFCALCMVFGVIGIVEYNKLMSTRPVMNLAALATDVFAMLCLTSIPLWQLLPQSSLMASVLFGVILLTLYLLVRFLVAIYDSGASATHDVAYSVFGVLYIGMGLVAAELMAIYSPMLVLLLFIFIWINDTGAFLVGSRIGKHRLFERLSPKKSWEGFAGGLLLVVIVSLVLGYTGTTGKMLGEIPYFGIGPYQLVYALPIVAVVFATWGDLFESMLKRSVAAKDSGNLIPGHGGLLDRIDSMLFVMPAAALMILFCILL